MKRCYVSVRENREENGNRYENTGIREAEETGENKNQPPRRHAGPPAARG